MIKNKFKKTKLTIFTFFIIASLVITGCAVPPEPAPPQELPPVFEPVDEPGDVQTQTTRMPEDSRTISEEELSRRLPDDTRTTSSTGCIDAIHSGSFLVKEKVADIRGGDLEILLKEVDDVTISRTPLSNGNVVVSVVWADASFYSVGNSNHYDLLVDYYEVYRDNSLVSVQFPSSNGINEFEETLTPAQQNKNVQYKIKGVYTDVCKGSKQDNSFTPLAHPGNINVRNWFEAPTLTHEVIDGVESFVYKRNVSLTGTHILPHENLDVQIRVKYPACGALWNAIEKFEEFPEHATKIELTEIITIGRAQCYVSNEDTLGPFMVEYQAITENSWSGAVNQGQTRTINFFDGSPPLFIDAIHYQQPRGVVIGTLEDSRPRR